MSATLFEAESRTIPRGTIPSKGRLRIHVRGIIPFSMCAPVKKRGKKKKKEKRTRDWTWLRLRLSSAYI